LKLRDLNRKKNVYLTGIMMPVTLPFASNGNRFPYHIKSRL